MYFTAARAAASAPPHSGRRAASIAAMSRAAEAAFRKWYRTQSVAAVLCTGFLVVEKPVAMGLAAELGVLALAAFTGACGWRLLRCTKQELVVLYQLYAVLCTCLCMALVYVVMMPAFRAFAFRAEGAAVADHHVAATFASWSTGASPPRPRPCANTRRGRRAHPQEAGLRLRGPCACPPCP